MTYHQHIHTAQESLLVAIGVAAATLPPAVTRQHWMSSKQSPSPWRAVEAQYRNATACDPTVLDTLMHLSLMSEALSCLISISTETVSEQPPPNLTLKKVRRTA